MSKQRFGNRPIEEFIKFEFLQKSPSGKTNVWIVINTMNPEQRDEIGFVRWHGPWRKYVFQSPDDSFFDWDFLRHVAEFTELQTINHKESKK